MAAAVADFRPAATAETKLERGDGLTLELEPTPDILAEVARIVRGLDSDGAADARAVGHARSSSGSPPRPVRSSAPPTKLRRKGVDLLVANDVAEAGSGFGTDTNRVQHPRARRRSATRCRCSSSARSRIGCSTASPPRWTRATPPRRLRDDQPQPGAGMSATADTARRLTVADIASCYADGERIPMLTAYDYPTAQILDEAGIPLLLVGDSLGQVMLGYETTVRVTMAEMLHHTKAVVRGIAARDGRRRHAVPDLLHARRGARERRRLPARGRRPGRQGRGRRAQRPRSSRRWSGPASRSWATSA